jgi:hypothetical protein
MIPPPFLEILWMTFSARKPNASRLAGSSVLLIEDRTEFGTFFPGLGHEKEML